MSRELSGRYNAASRFPPERNAARRHEEHPTKAESRAISEPPVHPSESAELSHPREE